ncbi:hypothetical protein PFISCL1PPCAC_4740, partial [Pristionchus fissidentatus]
MTRLAYTRLPTNDGDIEMQMPQEPTNRIAPWKIAAPLLFVSAFLILNMDVLSFSILPERYFRSGGSIERRISESTTPISKYSGEQT